MMRVEVLKVHARELYKRLEAIQSGGGISLSQEDVQLLLSELVTAARPGQFFKCVCGSRDFGPEDYRDVEEGETFECDDCGVEITRFRASDNVLVALRDEGDDAELADVTQDYREPGLRD